ncbi:MAG: zinc metallopeptidase, partial [Clostridia bacterium]|nr:zinc metallopeptidase [Clostridia bacterium]
VYGSTSIAAVGVAAHECGHAIQEARGYFPNKLRMFSIPLANIGTYAAFPIFFIGLAFSYGPLQTAGILLFSLCTFFYLVTLPVEFDASRRALKILGNESYLTSEELSGARKVLSAAALTYLAAALMSLLQLLRLILLSRRRR